MNPLAGIATLMVLLGIAVQFSLHRQIPKEALFLPQNALFSCEYFVGRVEEGHVGVYFRGGAMLGGMATPG